MLELYAKQMKPIVLKLAIVNFIVYTLCFSIANATQRTALVIGNSNYKRMPLKNPGNDAQDIATKLRQLGFEVIQKNDTTRKQMKQAIRKFENRLRKKGGVGLFYYAGHGIQVNGTNYLIPLNAEIKHEYEIPDEALSANSVLRAMESAKNEMNIVILDACRDNPFARSWRSTSRGLARMDAPTGSLVAYATAPGKTAADGAGNNGRNGMYTHFLLKYISEPKLTLNQVFMRVRIAVEKETGGEQIPWEESSLRGDFYFIENIDITLPEQSSNIETLVDSNAEVIFWNSIKDSQNEKYFSAYLNRYGANGIYGEIAKIKVNELKSEDTFSTIVSGTKQQIQSINSIFSDNSATSNGIEFINVAPGCFQMGNDDGRKFERPAHKVCLTQGYNLGKYEVTQFQWEKVMDNNPSYFKGRNKPVEQISWDDVQKFISLLGQLTGQQFRLPTEAEWEYACRSGGKNQINCGSDNGNSVAWYNDNSKSMTHNVGQKQANDLGFYDMSGNVWEWVQDRYDPEFYNHSPKNNPNGPLDGSYRTFRGGGWNNDFNYLHSSGRGFSTTDGRDYNLGFRLVKIKQ